MGLSPQTRSGPVPGRTDAGPSGSREGSGNGVPGPGKPRWTDVARGPARDGKNPPDPCSLGVGRVADRRRRTLRRWECRTPGLESRRAGLHRSLHPPAGPRVGRNSGVSGGVGILTGYEAGVSSWRLNLCRVGKPRWKRPMRVATEAERESMFRQALRACLKSEWSPAARDFGRARGGEAGASPQRAVTAEPTKSEPKRTAARRVFEERAV